METKLETYLSVAEKVTREIAEIGKPKAIPQYIAQQISHALGSEIQYAFIDLGTNMIYESSLLDSTVKHILPFFLDPRFIEEMTKLDWSVIDQRGVRFLLEKIGAQDIDFDSSFR